MNLSNEFKHIRKELRTIKKMINHRIPRKVDKKALLIKILELTDVTPKILIESGLYNDISNASKALKSLSEVATKKILTWGGHKQSVYRSINPELTTHQIEQSVGNHDSLTALFICKLVICLDGYNVDVGWRDKFNVGGKVTDGGIVLTSKNKVMYSILIETDMGTHDIKEVEEKFIAYSNFINNPERRVLFICENQNILQQRFQTLSRMVEGDLLSMKRFYFTVPQTDNIKKLVLTFR